MPTVIEPVFVPFFSPPFFRLESSSIHFPCYVLVAAVYGLAGGGMALLLSLGKRRDKKKVRQSQVLYLGTEYLGLDGPPRPMGRSVHDTKKEKGTASILVLFPTVMLMMT